MNSITPSPKCPELIVAADVPAVLTDMYASATTRAGLMAMAVDAEQAMGGVVDAFRTTVTTDNLATLFLPDSYSRMFAHEPPHKWLKSRRLARGMIELVDEFDQGSNSQAAFTHPRGHRGAYSLLPWGGRNHMKIYTADDDVLTAGGVNATGSSFESRDYLLRFKDRQIADWTWLLMQRLSKEKNLGTADLRLQTDYGTLMVDVGMPGQSIILSTVQELLARDDIDSVTLSSMFRNGGKVEKQLERLQKTLGRDRVQIMHTDLYVDDGGTVLFERAKERLFPARYSYNSPKEFLHAKFIVVRFKDGTVASVSGSNNFHVWGVRFGTAEIALLSDNDELATKLEAFAESCIPVPSLNS